jgi:hypothetical protein
MRLDFWECLVLVLTIWVCCITYNFLDWQWQLDYDKASHELFAVDPMVDTE